MYKNETVSVSDRTTVAGGKIVKYLIGAFCGIAATVILTMLFALVMTISAVPDGLVMLFTVISAIGGAFVCGFVSVLRCGSGGLFNGLVSGIIFFILHLTLTAAFGSGLFTVSTVIYAVTDIIGAAVGGIVAINTRR